MLSFSGEIDKSVILTKRNSVEKVVGKFELCVEVHHFNPSLNLF